MVPSDLTEYLNENFNVGSVWSGLNNNTEEPRYATATQYTQSQYISPAVSHFYGTEYEIWDGF